MNKNRAGLVGKSKNTDSKIKGKKSIIKRFSMTMYNFRWYISLQQSNYNNLLQTLKKGKIRFCYANAETEIWKSLPF